MSRWQEGRKIVTVSQSKASALTQDVMMLVWGYRFTQAISVMASLGIADTLRSGPLPVDEIARRCDADPSALRRLLRALTTIELVHEHADGRFGVMPKGDLLRRDHPDSLHDLALFVSDPSLWSAWGAMEGAVRTGTCAFDLAHGESLFDFMHHEPAMLDRFQAGMGAFVHTELPAILNAYDFGASTLIVDVAGGFGALLQGILNRHPHASGILFDLPYVVSEARAIRGTPEEARCTFMAGDMFERVPEGGDTYLLKLILHDWGDADCIRILRNCRTAMAPGGRVLIIDRVILPSNIPDIAKWSDLGMLAFTGGQERTQEEFAALYAEAGFALTGVYPAGGPSILEGRPI